MPKGVYDRTKKEEEVSMSAVETLDKFYPEVEVDPVEPLVKYPERPFRTVVHGYGKVPPGKRNLVDYTVFIGGVARKVHKDTARNWILGLRPEGTTKPYAVDGKAAYSSIDCIILDDDATEAEIMKAAGVPAMAVSKFAQFLKAYSTEELAQALGREKAIELSEGLRKAVGKS